jgi:hypothetical protein
VKPETRYRSNTINPFLAKLENLFKDSIQQKSKHGSGDYYLCLRGLFIYLEIKWYGGSLSEIQKDKMWEVVHKGKGLAICAHPGNWKEVKDLLSKLDEGEVRDVKSEVQRLNGVPIPNGHAKAASRTDRRKDRVPNQPRGTGDQGNSGENFGGV